MGNLHKTLGFFDANESPLLLTIQGKSNFTEKAQILVDVFYNKSPQTLIKRANSLNRLTGILNESGLAFPCSENDFYVFLKKEAAAGAPSSRLKAFFEAVVFVRHVLSLESLQQVVTSRRCLGATSVNISGGPRQADPFTVLQLQKLHEILRCGDEIWDQAMSGMLLFCIYGRSRWADAQHAAELVGDYDSSGELQALELKTAVHKTARAFHLRHMFLPICSPAKGVTDDNWGLQWLRIRDALQISDLKHFPLMPAPDKSLEPTRRPVSTQETKMWIQHLLGDCITGGQKLTSHSCKCTCLSFLAKRGVSIAVCNNDFSDIGTQNYLQMSRLVRTYEVCQDKRFQISDNFEQMTMIPVLRRVKIGTFDSNVSMGARSQDVNNVIQ